jgi:hypothetical protein
MDLNSIRIATNPETGDVALIFEGICCPAHAAEIRQVLCEWVEENFDFTGITTTTGPLQ